MRTIDDVMALVNALRIENNYRNLTREDRALLILAKYYDKLKQELALYKLTKTSEELGGYEGVQNGFMLVPIEPTEDMLFAAEVSKPRGYRDLYAAMLNAAIEADRAARGEPVAKIENGGLAWHLPDPHGSVPVELLSGTHPLYAHPPADRESAWQPIETAPKDGTPIVGWCDHEADPYYEEGGLHLTDYGARVEGLSHSEDGPRVIVWEDARTEQDGWEAPSYIIPGGWCALGDPEVVANPTHWMPLPAAPNQPEGWKLVPIEPTQEMCQAVRWDTDAFGSKSAWPSDVWRSMLKAAPNHSEGKE